VHDVRQRDRIGYGFDMASEQGDMGSARKSGRFFFAMIAALAVAVPLRAGNIEFPDEAAAARSVIADKCPSCLGGGVTLCGTAEVGFGQAFPRHFFSGTPKRGYLPGFRLSGGEFRALARSMSFQSLTQSLRQSFAALPLVVIDDDFAAARVIPTPQSVDVRFPEGLHQCVGDRSKAWGCCVTADCRQECCEKSLGSPRITVRWKDPEDGDLLVLRYSHTTGDSTLTRETGAGKKYIYWCITDEPALIQ
jgi:hypothetical protein